MAEVFGIVGGGVGVASLAIQITDSIRKLKGFCSLVKDTPEEVRLAIEEVEILSEVLTDIERGAQDGSARLPSIRSAVTRSIQLCRVSNDGLRTLAQDLSANSGDGKRWPTIKAALNRDKLERFRGRLESAKTTLLLANQYYYTIGMTSDGI
ncbi:MAG: hypothetical protein M1818_002946 [Claussenomyces sp. TS43310]|nr:MAG: hypothetical protein M1818_002946 [Claussenomyces sp. TS43310]